MIQRQNIYFYHKKSLEITSKLHSLCDLANENGFTVVKNSKDAHIIVSFGNDGDFLQAVRNSGFRDDCLYVSVSNFTKAWILYGCSITDVANLIDAIKSDGIRR